MLVTLGIGLHVDYQILFKTGRHLAAAGVRVFAYEDCPYAIHTLSGLDVRLDQIRHAASAPVLVSIAETLECRIEAIGCYTSQVPVIFRFTEDYASAVRSFLESRGNSQGLVERLWPVLLVQDDAG